MDKSLKEEIIGWIEESIVNEDFLQHQTCLIESPKKMDSYSGAVFSAKVIGYTKSGQSRKLYLVVKMSIRNKTVRERYGTDSYVRELYVYNTILPAFEMFQDEKNIKTPFKAYPKCYHTIFRPDTEVLVFENLRKLGYNIHDRRKPMDIDHIKLVLQEYAKLHALSFAMKDQKNDDFQKIFDGQPSILKLIYLQSDMISAYKSGVNKTREMLKQTENLDLAEKFNKIFKKDPFDILEDLTSDIPVESVIIHGDNWNNNYMYRYEDGDNAKPLEVSILDWQLCSIHSPVLDLSNFLYHVGSEKELDQLESLLRHYYDHFTKFLKELGSDPEKLFPFSKLMEHWKRYSLYALILCITLLEVALADMEEIHQINEMTEEDKLGDMVAKVRIQEDFDLYKDRILAMVKNYCQYCYDE